MFQHTFRKLAFGLACSIVTAAPVAAAPIAYRFVDVDLGSYETIDPGSIDGPFMRRDGTLFLGGWAGPTNPMAILQTRDGSTTPAFLAPPGEGLLQWRVNAAGDIAYTSLNLTTRTENIYIYKNGVSHLIPPGPGGITVPVLAIDDAANVYFANSISDNGIFKGTPSGTTKLFDISAGFFGFGDNLSVSRDGTLAFRLHLDRSSNEGVAIAKDGVLLDLIKPTSPIRFEAGRYDTIEINDHRVIALSISDDNGYAVAKIENGVLTELADSSGLYGLFNQASINNRGDVLYTGVDKVSDEGDKWNIFTTDSGRIIGDGDPLFGSTILDARIGAGYGDEGEFAFVAYLADGRRVIALALPIPEPSSLLLFLAGLGIALIIRSQHSTAY